MPNNNNEQFINELKRDPLLRKMVEVLQTPEAKEVSLEQWCEQIAKQAAFVKEQMEKYN